MYHYAETSAPTLPPPPDYLRWFVRNGDVTGEQRIVRRDIKGFMKN